MSANSKIEWTDHTFNPWIGCTKVSPACDHCYAEVSTPSRTLGVNWGAGQERRRTSGANWALPVRWNAQAEAFMAQHGRRQRVFCASLADVFDNEVDPIWRSDLFKLIYETPSLDWLLLTKRIGNVAHMIPFGWQDYGMPPNIWLGATICNQEEAARDIPKLLAAPARVRFLSMEPLLGPVDLERPRPGPDLDQGGGRMICQPWLIQSGIDWVIVGGESGTKARPMHPDWARSLRDQCASAGVPFLFKQWGEWTEFEPTLARTIYADSAEGKGLAAMCDGFISLQGEFVPDMGYASTDEPYRGMVRLGKKTAGRLLDGVQHDGYPR